MAASTVFNLWKKSIYYIHFTDRGYNSYNKYIGAAGDIQPDSQNWPFDYTEGGIVSSFNANYPGDLYMIFDNPSNLSSEFWITCNTITVDGIDASFEVSYDPALQMNSGRYAYQLNLGGLIHQIAMITTDDNTDDHSFTLICKG